MPTASDSLLTRLYRHGRPALRIGTAALLFGPGIRKFLTYEQSVGFFMTLDFPAPELLVVIVGSVEIGAALLLFLNRIP